MAGGARAALSGIVLTAYYTYAWQAERAEIKRRAEPTPVPAVVIAHQGASVRPPEEFREELVCIAAGKVNTISPPHPNHDPSSASP